MNIGLKLIEIGLDLHTAFHRYQMNMTSDQVIDSNITPNLSIVFTVTIY